MPVRGANRLVPVLVQSPQFYSVKSEVQSEAQTRTMKIQRKTEMCWSRKGRVFVLPHPTEQQLDPKATTRAALHHLEVLEIELLHSFARTHLLVRRVLVDLILVHLTGLGFLVCLVHLVHLAITTSALELRTRMN